MADSGLRPYASRARIGWWLFVAVLGLAAAFIAYSFVGLIVLGVFGYYATRPIAHRIERVVDSDGLAAMLTVSLVLVPLVALLAYVGFRVFQQAQQLLGDTAGPLPFTGVLEMLSPEQRESVTTIVERPQQLLTNPDGTVQTVLQLGVDLAAAVFGGLLLVALSVSLAYFLLERDDELAAGLRDLFGGTDTTAYAYASAVDEDLESVFFGNFLFVLVMALVATVAYWATNVVAPASLHVPMIFVLGFLTGIASLIPIVVGKVVYLPVVGYLALQAAQTDGNQFAFVGIALVAYFLVLDILPQTFLQPYITGRKLDVMVLLFAYLLGPVLFGWYGFFFLPIVFVLMLETVRIVLPELVHGDAVEPDVVMGESVGSTPDVEREPGGDEANDGASTPAPDADDGRDDGRDEPATDGEPSG